MSLANSLQSPRRNHIYQRKAAIDNAIKHLGERWRPNKTCDLRLQASTMPPFSIETRAQSLIARLDGRALLFRISTRGYLDLRVMRHAEI